jgi:tetratricopeptide (TPR) repeat protein
MSYASLKALGSAAFVEKDWGKANALYLRASNVAGISPEEAAIVFCNAATCNFQLAAFTEAAALATKALSRFPNYLKALYRRAQVRNDTSLFMRPTQLSI